MIKLKENINLKISCIYKIDSVCLSNYLASIQSYWSSFIILINVHLYDYHLIDKTKEKQTQTSVCTLSLLNTRA